MSWLDCMLQLVPMLMRPSPFALVFGKVPVMSVSIVIFETFFEGLGMY
jgi:hypothetical protein